MSLYTHIQEATENYLHHEKHQQALLRRFCESGAVIRRMTVTYCNFVPYLCQLVFAAILWVKLLHMFATMTVT